MIFCNRSLRPASSKFPAYTYPSCVLEAGHRPPCSSVVSVTPLQRCQVHDCRGIATHRREATYRCSRHAWDAYSRTTDVFLLEEPGVPSAGVRIGAVAGLDDDPPPTPRPSLRRQFWMAVSDFAFRRSIR